MSGVPEDVAKLVSEVRHEINNSLMAILGYVELLSTRGDLPRDAVGKLRSIETESFRIRDAIARTSFIRR